MSNKLYIQINKMGISCTPITGITKCSPWKSETETCLGQFFNLRITQSSLGNGQIKYNYNYFANLIKISIL